MRYEKIATLWDIARAEIKSSVKAYEAAEREMETAPEGVVDGRVVDDILYFDYAMSRSQHAIEYKPIIVKPHLVTGITVEVTKLEDQKIFRDRLTAQMYEWLTEEVEDIFG